ncbi:protein NATD1 [Culex quinquefasciatus]|uniref:protein NATD1 n=1 Tax=Culex quinquefasciatus TaxID=7176 RepID=UPI0018E39929|nr:protein NATD1 [Culex quinquefasciatus]
MFPVSQVLSRSRYLTRLAKAEMCSGVLQIGHDPTQAEFSVHLNESKAFLSYRLDRKARVLSLDHTEVPAVFQGKGVGKKLVEAALQHAVQEDLKVKIYCDFALKYYRDNEAQLAGKIKYVPE